MAKISDTPVHPYFTAVKAEAAFQEALISEYGGGKATEMRYKPRHAGESTELRAAYEAKLAADRSWLGSMHDF